MTRNEFDWLCSRYLIDPAIALENDDIVAALQPKYTPPTNQPHFSPMSEIADPVRAKVEEILQTQF